MQLFIVRNWIEKLTGIIPGNWYYTMKKISRKIELIIEICNNAHLFDLPAAANYIC